MLSKLLLDLAVQGLSAPGRTANQLLDHCCRVFRSRNGVLLQFEGGDSGPWARRIVHIDYRTRQPDVFRSAEHFPCDPTTIEGPTLADQETLAHIGRGWLNVFFEARALIIPCIGRPLGFNDDYAKRAGAIILD